MNECLKACFIRSTSISFLFFIFLVFIRAGRVGHSDS
jgi:hypothetical protein